MLRHTYASIILEAGPSPTITLDHYANFMPEAGNKWRKAIDALPNRASAETSAA